MSYPTFHPLARRPRLRDRLRSELNDLGIIGTIVVALLVIVALVVIGNSLFPRHIASTPVTNTAAQTSQAPAQVNVTVNNGSNNTNQSPVTASTPNVNSTTPAPAAQPAPYSETVLAAYCGVDPFPNGGGNYSFVTDYGQPMSAISMNDQPLMTYSKQYWVTIHLGGEGPNTLVAATPKGTWGDCLNNGS